MPVWATGFVWLGLYWTTVFVIPREKLCKGLFTRHVLRRIVPPRSIWNLGNLGHSYRYMLWLGVTLILEYGYPRFSEGVWYPLFWGVIILIMLDDWFFGDDEWRKKLWEGVRNKVKWLMELPPAPAHQETA